MKKLTSFLTTALIAAVVSLGVVHFSQNNNAAPAKETAYDRIMRTNVLRCGYIVYPPNLAKDPNTGAFSGISYDIIMRLAQDLGLTVEWAEETGPGSMVEGLNANRYDLICASVWTSSPRGKVALFSTPLYFTSINAYARIDDARFQDSLKNIGAEGVKIATVDGGLAAAIAKEDFPKVGTYSLPELTDFSHLLLAVKDKRADVTFSEVAQAALFEKTNPGSLRNTTPDHPVRLFANAFLMKAGEGRLAEMLNNALHNLHNNGFIEKALSAHETQPNQYRRVTPAYQ